MAAGLSLVACIMPAIAADEPCAVLSIRQYQVEGPSYLHLYLYTLDGHLVKQLSSTPGIDDDEPLFSQDGKTILFCRHARTADTQASDGYAIVDLATGVITQVGNPDVPAEEQKRKPRLGTVSFAWPSDKPYQPDPAEGDNATSSASWNGEYKLIRKPGPQNGDRYVYFLKTKGTPEAVNLASFPGYPTYGSMIGYPEIHGKPFLFLPGFNVLFLMLHVTSSDGESMAVFDLESKKWIVMGDNGERAEFLNVIPGEANRGIIFLHSQLGEQLGQPHTPEGKDVQCLYLEIWNHNFQPIQLGPPVSLFHGGAFFYGPDKTAVVPDPKWGS